jgi:hypothetical protein
VPAIGAAQANQSRVETALTNIVTLHRPGQDGVATVWDGNKYIQCRLQLDRAFRCEAAGTLMQPSLARVLSPERITKLHTLGWTLDSSFGNYVQIFPSGSPVKDIAERLLQALKDGYEANISDLEVGSDWIKSERCPPRNGPSQNLAGMISDALSMTGFRVHGCSYKPNDEPLPQVRSKADLIHVHGTRVAGEIQRLRVNIDRQRFTWVAVDTGGGYIQCGTAPPRAIYCEAQSAETWPVLARILTAERVAQLHAAGYADPGRAPNYWKNYSLDEFTDRAIAEELLAILYDVYAYSGVPKLEFKTNQN